MVFRSGSMGREGRFHGIGHVSELVLLADQQLQAEPSAESR